MNLLLNAIKYGALPLAVILSHLYDYHIKHKINNDPQKKRAGFMRFIVQIIIVGLGLFALYWEGESRSRNQRRVLDLLDSQLKIQQARNDQLEQAYKNIAVMAATNSNSNPQLINEINSKITGLHLLKTDTIKLEDWISEFKITSGEAASEKKIQQFKLQLEANEQMKAVLPIFQFTLGRLEAYLREIGRQKNEDVLSNIRDISALADPTNRVELGEIRIGTNDHWKFKARFLKLGIPQNFRLLIGSDDGEPNARLSVRTSPAAVEVDLSSGADGLFYNVTNISATNYEPLIEKRLRNFIAIQADKK